MDGKLGETRNGSAVPISSWWSAVKLKDRDHADALAWSVLVGHGRVGEVGVALGRWRDLEDGLLLGLLGFGSKFESGLRNVAVGPRSGDRGDTLHSDTVWQASARN